uniref:Protein YIF1 n=1 Tax=Oryzias sinensis TaxID=183150 RepID=A0A8C8DMP2_9TELE
MDLSHHGYRATKQRARPAPPTGDPVLFEDTSSAALGPSSQGYYASGYNMEGPPNDTQGAPGMNNLFADPMASAAMMYGSSLANRGQEIVNKEIGRFMSVNKLKYFFAVDTRYVLKKLMILMFPYTHQDWDVRYHRDTQLTPRQDVNAPDLYIPTMAFITYILLAGMALGIQKRFSPEVLGLCASTALVWVIIEVLIMLLSLYLLTVHSDLSTFDLIAYSGYKYVGIIFTMTCGLLFGSDGYFVALAWSSFAIMFFIQESCTPAEPPPPPPPASSKPPYSFSSLIFMAIEDSPHKKLPVKDIYEWIVKNFPYYRSASGGWRNSVRHNLSLSKSFRRIQRDRTQVTMQNLI